MAEGSIKKLLADKSFGLISSGGAKDLFSHSKAVQGVSFEELRERVKLFGECMQTEGESSAEFYERLRHWYDRDIPQTKSPRHSPRQASS